VYLVPGFSYQPSRSAGSPGSAHVVPARRAVPHLRALRERDCTRAGLVGAPTFGAGSQGRSMVPVLQDPSARDAGSQ
jgi:hypothetical protein